MSEPKKNQPSPFHAWRWPIALLLGLLLALLFFAWMGWQTQRTLGRAATQLADEAKEIAERFSSTHITETFISSIPQIAGDGAGRLEVASLTITERIERSDEKHLFWEMIPLGKTAVEIEVPVTYRYYLRLNDGWNLHYDEHHLTVEAPILRPSLPPAIHSHRMRKRQQADWLRFDADQQMDELERSLTPSLTSLARDSGHLDLVRDQARRTVARFVQIWLFYEGQWKEERFDSITVVFADEEGLPKGPTISLDPKAEYLPEKTGL